MYDFASQISSSHFTSHALIIYTVCFTFQLGILETIKKNFETTNQLPKCSSFQFWFRTKIKASFYACAWIRKGILLGHVTSAFKHASLN